MMTARAMMLAIACLACAAAPASAQQSNDAKPNRVRGEYVPPKNPAHQYIYDRLTQRRVLERLSEFLSPFKLPRALLLKVAGCDGTTNAFYEDGVVTVCYEYLDYIHRNTPKEPVAGGLTSQDAVIGPTVDVFLHEVGHAVFDLLEVPLLGREEDAADLFSAYIQLQIGKQEARILILGIAFLGQREMQEAMAKSLELKDYANEHGLPAQRYFNVLCMAYGFDKELFADAISHWHLPPERAEGCEDEYAEFDYAFETLIAPHLDEALLEKVKARKWLQFEAQR
jgi:putative metallopeptidase DUF4344